MNEQQQTLCIRLSGLMAAAIALCPKEAKFEGRIAVLMAAEETAELLSEGLETQ
jgi:hypothetical protein